MYVLVLVFLFGILIISLCFVRIAQGFAVFTPIEDGSDLVKELKAYEYS